MKRLPDAEFYVMKVIWSISPPVTAGMVMEGLGEQGWKVQTVMSLLGRLADKGFVRTEKQGRQRTYSPVISREEYLRFETGNFIKQYHGDSLVSLVNTLVEGKGVDENELAELMRWVKERGE